MKKYVENMKKYVKNMKEYVKNMKKNVNIFDLAPSLWTLGLAKIPSFLPI